MFVALDETEKFVIASEKLDKNQNFLCPVCRKSVQLKMGTHSRPHFAHFTKSIHTKKREGETNEHREGKETLYYWSRQKTEINVELEPYISSIDQRPDVLIESKLAFEIQCSPISIQQLTKRCVEYQKIGISPIWFCGKKLHINEKLSDLNRALMNYAKNIGFYYWEIHQQKQQIRLLFNIEETLDHKIHYDTFCISFNQMPIQKVLKLPQFISKLSPRKYEDEKIIAHFYRELQQKLYFKDRRIIQLQEKFYQQKQNLLDLPKYYYYPVIRPLFCAEEAISWKFSFYNFLKNHKVASNFQFNKQMKLHSTPLISKKTLLNHFINQEMVNLRNFRKLKN
ncbi:MAG: hypothetical protein LBT69_00140 [Lactobacillales bacterium]|jgi:competence protein CoiA|nr:hypothetical protein [Lactobacillales bacterium]